MGNLTTSFVFFVGIFQRSCFLVYVDLFNFELGVITIFLLGAVLFNNVETPSTPALV